MQGWERVVGSLLPLGPVAQAPLRTGGGKEGEPAVRGTLKLQPVPWLWGQSEGDRLPTLDIHVPVWQLEVIVPAGQARAVVDTRPRRLRNTVIRAVHPLLEIPSIRELNFAYIRHWIGKISRRVARPIPTVTKPPFIAPSRYAQVPSRRRSDLRARALGERRYICVHQDMVVNPDLV